MNTTQTYCPECYAKKRNRAGFSIIEIIVAVAIFSAAATTLATSMANGLLSRHNLVKNRAQNQEYALIAHITQNMQFVDTATRMTRLTLPSGNVVPLKISLSATKSKNLFAAEICLDNGRHYAIFTNKNW